MENVTKRIYLTGFMTSGKSTIGPILANVIGWEFCDLDREIEKHEEKSVVEIFENNGEEYFRNLEHKLLIILSKKTNIVLSLGGGTMAFDRNLSILKNTGITVYLKSSPEMIYQRIKNKIDRPIFRDLVLSGNAKPIDFINRIDNLLLKREPYYLESNICINTDLSNIGTTVDKLAKTITKVINENN